MIDVLRQQISPAMTAEEKTNRVREFLQILILKILSDRGYFTHLAFVGGTALRILYNLRRFSEDLDFSLMIKKGYKFRTIVANLEKDLRLFGLEPELKPKEDKMVQSLFLKFPNLLGEIGISVPSGQKLSIRVEIDTNPPKGAITETTIINRTYLFTLLRFDLTSLYATKLHACFFRKYTKGRDYYDLVWYLGKKIEPNYKLLNNSIIQTEGYDMKLNRDNLSAFIVNRLQKVDFRVVRRDVERFLEDKTELKLLDFNIINDILRNL
jgi:predicted nucleotidyltransferase component of viral defense system